MTGEGSGSQPGKDGAGTLPGAGGEVGDEGTDLITSPLRRVRFGRAFVICGPIGLAIALVLSLWVSTIRVHHSLLIQVEPAWVLGEHLALRAQLVSDRDPAVPNLRLRAAVEQGGGRRELGSVHVEAPTQMLSLGFDVPRDLTAGAAVLELEMEGDGVEVMRERMDVEITTSRAPRVAAPVVSGSTLQYADDSDPQPDARKIVVRAGRRLLAGFDNALFIRVTDPAGAPWLGSVIVALVDGEFMGRVGAAVDPPILHAGPADRLGLVVLEGPVGTEVLRLDVRCAETGAEPAHRMVRLVSFAGGVDVIAEPDVVRPGDSIDVRAWGLSSKALIHVDVHGPDGAFLDVMRPPVVGREPARPWQVPPGVEGLFQFEAHNHVAAPGESTALTRVQVTSTDPSDVASLLPLVALHRATVERRVGEAGYDPALERAYLDRLPGLAVDPEAVAAARRWLLATATPAVFGPPTGLSTRPRLEAEVVRVQHQWHVAMRVFLLGGGLVFLAAMASSMISSQRRASELTLAELRSQEPDPAARAAITREIHAASRAAIARGFGILAMMFAALVLTVFILESLVWVF